MPIQKKKPAAAKKKMMRGGAVKKKMRGGGMVKAAKKKMKSGGTVTPKEKKQKRISNNTLQKAESSIRKGKPKLTVLQKRKLFHRKADQIQKDFAKKVDANNKVRDERLAEIAEGDARAADRMGMPKVAEAIRMFWRSTNSKYKKEMRGGGMVKTAKKKMMRGGAVKKKMRGGGMVKTAKKKMMRGGMAKKKR